MSQKQICDFVLAPNISKSGIYERRTWITGSPPGYSVGESQARIMDSQCI
jgi:hypothetical protein